MLSQGHEHEALLGLQWQYFAGEQDVLSHTQDDISLGSFLFILDVPSKAKDDISLSSLFV